MYDIVVNEMLRKMQENYFIYVQTINRETANIRRIIQRQVQSIQPSVEGTIDSVDRTQF
jgi:hypothetical protein